MHITDLCCLSVITKHYFLASNKTKLWQFIPMILNSIKNVVHQNGSFNLGSLYIYRPKHTESLKPIIYFYFRKFNSTRHTKSLTRMPCNHIAHSNSLYGTAVAWYFLLFTWEFVIICKLFSCFNAPLGIYKDFL